MNSGWSADGLGALVHHVDGVDLVEQALVVGDGGEGGRAVDRPVERADGDRRRTDPPGRSGAVHSRFVIVTGPPTAVHSIHSDPPSTNSFSRADSTVVPVPSTSAEAIVRALPSESDPRNANWAEVDVSSTSRSCTSGTVVQRWK